MVLIRTRWFTLTKRGAVLLLAGVLYVLLGVSYTHIPPEVAPVLRMQLGGALGIAPIGFYVWLWIGSGALAILGGLVHALDALGFFAAVFMPAAWGLAFFYGAWQGAPRAWVNGSIFVVFALILTVVAAMADPYPRRADVGPRWVRWLR